MIWSKPLLKKCIFSSGILCSILLHFSIDAFGQSDIAQLNSHQLEHVEAYLKQYFTEIAMTPDQQSKFEEITKKYALKMQQVANSNDGLLSKYRQLKHWRDEKYKEMKNLLDAHQYQKYETIQESIYKEELRKRVKGKH